MQVYFAYSHLKNAILFHFATEIVFVILPQWMLWPNLWQNRSAQVLKTIFKPNSLNLLFVSEMNYRLNFYIIFIKMIYKILIQIYVKLKLIYSQQTLL